MRRPDARRASPSRRPIRTSREALAFLKKHGVVLQAARGNVPTFTEAIAGARIRGSWWGHPLGKTIFRVLTSVCESPDVLICRLVDGKITLVHRRLWPALVRLADRFPRGALAAVAEEHTPSGAHRTITTPFPRWVPPEVREAARRLSVREAETILAGAFPPTTTVITARAARGGSARRGPSSRSGFSRTSSVRAVSRS